MTLILIQVTCLVFSLILVITFFVRKNYNSLENKLFKWLMISNNIGLVLELICYYAFSISSKNIIIFLWIFFFFDTHLNLFIISPTIMYQKNSEKIVEINLFFH